MVSRDRRTGSGIRSSVLSICAGLKPRRRCPTIMAHSTVPGLSLLRTRAVLASLSARRSAASQRYPPVSIFFPGRGKCDRRRQPLQPAPAGSWIGHDLEKLRWLLAAHPRPIASRSPHAPECPDVGTSSPSCNHLPSRKCCTWDLNLPIGHSNPTSESPDLGHPIFLG